MHNFNTCFYLCSKVMTPYRNNGNLTPVQRRYNYIQSAERMPVERSNEHWKEKWRRLYRLHVLRHDYALDHIMATLMLHNFVELGGREPVSTSL